MAQHSSDDTVFVVKKRGGGSRPVYHTDPECRALQLGRSVTRKSRTRLSDDPVIENSLFRVRFDEAAGALSAWTWDDAGGAWSSVTLGDETDGTDWTVHDVNVKAISPAAVRAQVEFYETTGTDSGGVQYYNLDLVLPRGYTEPQWFVPLNETPPTPTGLQDKLAPVASPLIYDVDGADKLVAREEVDL